MNQYTETETRCAIRVTANACAMTRWYADDEDREAATIALLIEALILAGGASFLKPTEENQ